MALAASFAAMALSQTISDSLDVSDACWDERDVISQILPGCPGPLAVLKKLVQKNFVRIFRSLVI